MRFVRLNTLIEMEKILTSEECNLVNPLCIKGLKSRISEVLGGSFRRPSVCEDKSLMTQACFSLPLMMFTSQVTGQLVPHGRKSS